MKVWQAIVLVVVLVVVGLGGYVFVQLRTIDVEQLSEQLWVLRGMGGNTAVLKTDDGAVVVDTMTLPMQGDRIREVARELTGMDTVLLINSHYHLDHTHGNPAFDPSTKVVSTRRTLSHLNALDADFWEGDARELMPNETFDDSHILRVGGQRLELLHPGRGHTDGDLVVVFVEDRVVHMGDLHFNDHYPNIDLEAGGSVKEWPETLGRVLALDSFDRVIPGHGATAGRESITQFQGFMQQLADIGARAKAGNWTLEDTLATDELTAVATYEQLEMFISLGLDRAFVLQRAWEEVTGNFVLLNE